MKTDSNFTFPLVYTQFMLLVFRKTGEEDNLTSACKLTASKMFLFPLNLERTKELAKFSPAPKSPTKQEKQFGEDVQKEIRRLFFFLSLISSSRLRGNHFSTFAFAAV